MYGLLSAFLCCGTALAQQQQHTVEMIPFGDMDQWIDRQIKESGIIGGALKNVYAIGPTATIRENKAYKNMGGSPWATSNVVALSKNGKTEYMGNLITLTLPLDRQEFLQTVAVLVSSKSSFTRRKEADEDLISNAKLVLMNTQDMTELQAHRFLQKESMRTGLKITDLAQKIINDFR